MCFHSGYFLSLFHYTFIFHTGMCKHRVGDQGVGLGIWHTRYKNKDRSSVLSFQFGVSSVILCLVLCEFLFVCLFVVWRFCFVEFLRFLYFRMSVRFALFARSEPPLYILFEVSAKKKKQDTVQTSDLLITVGPKTR